MSTVYFVIWVIWKILSELNYTIKSVVKLSVTFDSDIGLNASHSYNLILIHT